MPRHRLAIYLFVALILFAPAANAQLGKTVLIPAGSEVNSQLNAITAATDPAKKLELLDTFSAAHPDGDLQLLILDQYVTTYISTKQYDKAFAAGDKLFALDPDNYNNSVNLVRAASESGNIDRLFTYGEKSNAIIQRYKTMPPPADVSQQAWDQQRDQKLATIKEDQDYVERSVLSSAYQQTDPTKKAELLARFAKTFPNSSESVHSLVAASYWYQQAQNRPKMIETANSVLEKDPQNIDTLLLLSDDYGEHSEQLDKAEEYAKKAIALCDTVKKPQSVSDVDWQKQITLQKGLALSALGQVDLAKKLNAPAVDNLTKAAPLLKPNNLAYARNQYRLGFAYANLKKSAEARQAFTDAASVESPYKGPAQEKLKALANAKPAGKSAAKKPQ